MNSAFMIPTEPRDQHGNPVLRGLGQKTQLPREIWHQQTGMELVLVEPGEFQMGSPANEKDRDRDEGPQHRVRITKPFYLGKYEVTQGQWKKIMGQEPWSGETYAKSNASHSASYISWDDCQEFIRKLSARGGTLSLPTEAEWECACRAASTTVFCYGDDAGDLGEYAWYVKNAYDIGEKSAHRVGQRPDDAVVWTR